MFEAVAVTVAVGVAVVSGAYHSNAPISGPGPFGRGLPSKSVSGAPDRPASMAGLSGSRCISRSAGAANRGSAKMLSEAFGLVEVMST